MPTAKRQDASPDTRKTSDHLDHAKKPWPETWNRNDRLPRLTKARFDGTDRQAAGRPRAIKVTADALSGIYEPGKPELLREGWSD